MFWALLERTREYRRELCWLTLGVLATLWFLWLVVAGMGGLNKGVT